MLTNKDTSYPSSLTPSQSSEQYKAGAKTSEEDEVDDDNDNDGDDDDDDDGKWGSLMLCT